MIYFLACLLSVLFSLKLTKQRTNYEVNRIDWSIRTKNSNTANIVLMILAGVPPFFVSAFRYDIGTDYFYSYVPRFQDIVAGMDTYFERGFHYLNVLIALFTDNYQWLFIVTSFLFIAFVYKTIYDQASNIPMAIIMLFLTYTYFISLNNIRQSLAMAMVLYALKYLKEKHYGKFIVWVIAAGFIHQVAFICLIFTVLDKIKLSAKWAVVFSTAALILAQTVAPFLLSQLAKIERFSMYLESGLYAERTMSRMGILFNLCILIMFAFMEWLWNDTLKKDSEWNQIIWWQCLLVCCSALDGIVPAIYRIARVFSFGQFLLMVNAVEKAKSKEWKIIYYIIILAIFGIMYLQMYITGAEEIFPYKSIFFK